MNSLIVSLLVVVGLLGGFYAGVKYGQGHPASTAATAARTTSPGTSGFGAAAGAQAGSALSGRVVSVDKDLVVLQERGGKQVKVNVAGARIVKIVAGSSSDLAPDITLTVVGQAGPDDTVNAQLVSVGGLPGVFGGAADGHGRPTPSPS